MQETSTNEALAHLGEVGRALIAAGQRLGDATRAQVLALGDAAVPELVALLGDEDLQQADAPGDGWGPIHAAKLLGELKAEAAVDPLLAELRSGDFMSYLHDSALSALQAIGRAAREPVLAAHAATADPDYRGTLTAVLSELGVRDPRIYNLLLQTLAEDVTRGAMELSAYGDPAALPHLAEALDRYRILETDSPLKNHAVIELRAAIEELGGELTPEQRRKVTLSDQPRQRWAKQLNEALARRSQPAAPRRPGRNDPCPCGSGKKYKKCHLLLEG